MKKVVACLTLVASLAVCSSDKPAVFPTSTATPTPTPTDASDLAALLPDKPPDGGYTVVQAQSGPLSLDEAAARDKDPEAERRRLRVQGFLRGYARTWDSPGADIVILIVSEFSSNAGAGKELANSETDAAASGATRFEVPGIEGAVGLTQTEQDGDVFHAVAFVRGRRLFVAAVGGPQGSHEPSEAIDLARKIVALL
jgi:hypothetical protein